MGASNFLLLIGFTARVAHLDGRCWDLRKSVCGDFGGSNTLKCIREDWDLMVHAMSECQFKRRGYRHIHKNTCIEKHVSIVARSFNACRLLSGVGRRARKDAVFIKLYTG